MKQEDLNGKKRAANMKNSKMPSISKRHPGLFLTDSRMLSSEWSRSRGALRIYKPTRHTYV